MTEPPPPEPSPSRSPLVEVALYFLRLGAIAFGGPAAHIAMMQDDLVTRRRWLSNEEFLDLVGATNLVPGPNSTELAIHLGHHRAGFPGLVVAGVCFIAPAMALTTAIAWGYTRYHALPAAGAILYGIKPVMIAVVLQAILKLGKTALKSKPFWALGVAALALSFLRLNELAILFGAGFLVALLRPRPKPPSSEPSSDEPSPGSESPPPESPPSTSKLGFLVPALGGAAAGAAAPVSLTSLFLVFAKIGAVLFGSGYVLLAFLRADLVEQRHWLTEPDLLDAIAVGQMTPGPVLTTATFIGYRLAGLAGAVVATVGIFAPAFLVVALSGPLIPRLRRSPIAGGFLDGVNVASLALMTGVAVELGRSAVVDVPAALIAVAAAVALLRWKVNSVWLIAAGALLGVAIRAVR